MFDFSFGELALVAVVALVVLGPERLPRVARTAGHLLGRARSYANQVKSDIDREMQLDELRKLQQEAQEAARSFESSVNEFGRTVETEAARLESEAAGFAGGQGISGEAEDPLATSLAEQARQKPVAGSAPQHRLDSPLAPAWQQTPAVRAGDDEAASALADSPLAGRWPTPQRPASPAAGTHSGS